MEKEIITKMVLITPESAKELLKLNYSNRPLNQSTVDWYAKQMTNGQWTISGQTISISDKNTLIDGQHRLAAIVKSGKEINFNIAYNVPIESFINYDNLRSRGLKDVLAIEEIPNGFHISSIISKYYQIKRNAISEMGFGQMHQNGTKGGGGNKREKVAHIDSLKLYNSNKDLFQECSRVADSCYDKLKLFSASQIGAIMFFLIFDKKHNKDKVFSFFRQLFFNENVENKAIYYLREKLINGSIGNFVMVPKLKYIYLVKCWNAFVIGKEFKIYSFNDSDVIPSFL